MGDNTDLKKFRTKLNTIGTAEHTIQMLQDCKDSQGDNFLKTAPCFNLTDGKVMYMGSEYTKSPNDAYSILHGIKQSDPSSLSYKDLHDSAVVTGYNSSASMYDIFEQDVIDLSGSINDAGKFDNDLRTTYTNVKTLRDELDNKMREIYNPEFQDSHTSYDQSIYITLSWTIVASSVLYYLFVRL